MAHKKAAWSAKNLRDSKPKYRWVKVFWWQKVLAWSIIVRQKWNKYEAGKNTYLGKDFSIHSNIDGIVEFSKANKTRFDGRKYLKTIVNVVPAIIVETKTVAKKEVEKKAPAKKPVAKKEVEAKPVKKTVEKKEVEKKAPAKKPAAKKPVAKKASK